MKHTALLCSVLTFSLLALACAPPTPEVDPAYRAQIEAWRGERLARLDTDDGWLTLIGLFWLEPGDNTVGSATESTVLLPEELAPPLAATITVADDGAVAITAAEDAELSVAGEPVTERALATDADGAADVVRLGRLSFHVIARGDRLAVRVKDPDAETRRNFAGIEAFAIDPGFRVEARFEPYETPREVTIPTVVGTEDTMMAPGLLHFELDGQPFDLEPFAAADGRLWLIFSDATSGEETYGAGRFLYVEPPVDGRAVIDFNRAYNPPCVFTPYATCPLPPARNHLEAAIRAGERYSGH